MQLDTLAPPPAPTGINQFPTPPEQQSLGQGALPDQVVSSEDMMGITIEVKEVGQVLKVYGQWILVVQATASPDTPFTQAVATTTGTSTTNTVTKQFSASLGVKADFLSIGASLTETTSTSVTLSQSTTTTRTFNATPKENTATICWWQEVITYEIEGWTNTYINGKQQAGQPFTSVMKNYLPSFIATQYPAVGGAKEVTLNQLEVEMA